MCRKFAKITRKTAAKFVILILVAMSVQTFILFIILHKCNFELQSQTNTENTQTKTTRNCTTTKLKETEEIAAVVQRKWQPSQTYSDRYITAEIDRRFLGNRSDFLGEGTFGAAYLTTYYGIPVAMKVFHTYHKLKKEVAILQRLGNWHPALPKLIAVQWQNPCAMLTTFHQFEDGEARSFENMLEAKNLMTSSQWLSIFIDLVEAVQYVHNIGLLHTDIKRDNLLIERRGGRYAGVLIDFSNSVPTNYTGKYKLNETEKIRWRERHHSMAPEVIEGRPWTVAMDVYSLGKQMQRVARKTTGLTDLKSLAKRCLSFNPKHRPSLSIVKETLFSLKHGNYNSIGSSHDDFHRNVF